MSYQIGYCTNVHAGANFQQMRVNLEQHAIAIKQQVAPNSPMPVGLWFSAQSARDVMEQNRTSELSAWLNESGLLPYTLNGFPYGDFHEPVVKHRVYRPTWWEADRLAYTLNIIHLLDAILPAGDEGSISTLPIAWPYPAITTEQCQQAARQLADAANAMARIESESGRLIYLCIEPEPGCLIQRSDDMVRFYDEQLLQVDNADEDILRRHIRVCHDVCHAVVMFEEQSAVFERYRDAGILVGKVQISSAIRVLFDNLDIQQRQAAIEELEPWTEDRYLHQTVVRRHDKDTFYEELQQPLSAASPLEELGEWRVHYHVPVFLEQFGLISTSRDAISECLAAATKYSDVRHFEVETYAWSVLPAALQTETLADGIAREMVWFRDLVERQCDATQQRDELE